MTIAQLIDTLEKGYGKDSIRTVLIEQVGPDGGYIDIGTISTEGENGEVVLGE